MKKPDIAKRIARQSRISVGEAADCLDRLVQEIVDDLRHGREAVLPGLGKFIVKPDGRLTFDPEGSRPRD
jgi:nucleoid DNA-binding protein